MNNQYRISNDGKQLNSWVLRFVTAFYNQRLKIAAPETNTLNLEHRIKMNINK